MLPSTASAAAGLDFMSQDLDFFQLNKPFLSEKDFGHDGFC